MATNRRARQKFELIEKMEAGIVLTGTEVKALREGNAQMIDSYAAIEDGEVWLRNLHIPHYAPATTNNHEPERPRKLLLHRAEIERLIGTSQQEGPDPDPLAHLLQGPGPRWSLPWRRPSRAMTGAGRSLTAT